MNAKLVTPSPTETPQNWHEICLLRSDMGRKVKKSAGKCPQCGGALIEFSLVFPLLFLIFAGILGIGQALEQFAWTSQSAYQIYLAGAEATSTLDRPQRMQRRWDLLQLKYSQYDSRAKRLNGSSYTNLTPPIPDSISARVAGSIETIIGTFTPNILSNTIVGPILALNSSLAGSLGTPDNTILYDCFGNRCDGSNPACGQTPCITCMTTGSPPQPSSSCSCVGNDPTNPLQVCQQ